MTLRETILANPGKTNKELAAMTGSSENTIRCAQARIRKSSKNTGLSAECEAVGIDFDKVNHFWYKGKNYSIHVKGEAEPTYYDLRDEIIADMNQHSPAYVKRTYEPESDPCLLLIDPADIHVGKLARSFEVGEDYNSQIAVQRVREGVRGIINKVRGYSFDKVMLVIGNDILHVDSPHNMTTSGTRQDTDGMWYDNFLIAKQIYVDTIELLMGIAPVHVQYDPSNHDYINGFFLADTLKSWFRNAQDVEFNASIAHRKYYRYGNNLIGTTHGDGAKETDLALLMANEAKSDWSECKHYYFYTHHIHHKKSKDYMNVTVESLRSPSGPDSWHYRNGYTHAPKAIEGYIHHPVHGQIARISHLF